jgi:uncharacterized membrane protein YdjX (TVP38/TMEM64 family)
VAARLTFRVLIATLFLGLVYYLYAYGYGQYLTLDYIKSQQQLWIGYQRDYFLWTLASFVTVYILITACSIPGAGILSLAGGGIFGLWLGTIVVCISATVGATFAFFSSRFLFRTLIQKKFGEYIRQINEEIKKEGPWVLVTIRMIPAFPFVLVNLLMGLTPMKPRDYFIFSFLGMLPPTFVYVNAGTQLAQITSVQDVFSADILLSFLLLAMFPLLAKNTIDFLKKKKS